MDNSRFGDKSHGMSACSCAEDGVPLEDAVGCATMNPAKEIGIFDRCGSITPGKYADFVLLDEELNVKSVYINGKRQ